MTGAVEIVFRGMPVELHARATSHVDAVRRELELVQRDAGDRRGPSDQEAAALLATMADLSRWLDSIDARTGRDPLETSESGESTFDRLFDAPVDVADQAGELLRSLEESSGHLREELLTVATPPDVRSFVEWILTECVRQSAGLRPRRWSTAALATQVTSIEVGEPGHVSGDDDDLIARAGADREGGEARLAGQPDVEGWDVATVGSTVSIRFHGELDLESSPHLRTLVANAASDAALSSLELDLSGVTFIDSVGLSALLTVRMRMVSDDVTVTVVPSVAVDRVFTLAGVRSLFVD